MGPITIDQIGVIEFVVGIVGVILTLWGVHTSWVIARKTRSLRQPSVRLRYGGAVLESRRLLKIVYALPPDADRRVIGILRFLVENTGGRAAEDVKLEIVVPAGANAGSEELSFRVGKGSLPGISRHCSRVGKLLHVYHHLPVVYARDAVWVNEPFWCEPTVGVQINPTVTTADGIIVQFNFTMTFSFIFDLVLFTKEESPFSSSVRLYCVEAKDREELIKRWIAEQDQSLPTKTSLWSMITQGWKWPLENRVLLVIPHFEALTVGEITAQWENFDKSERWWLHRSGRRWVLTPCNWEFVYTTDLYRSYTAWKYSARRIWSLRRA